MADPTPEKSDEIEKLDKRAEFLDKLVFQSLGKFLKAENTEQAKEAFSEFLFFDVELQRAEGTKKRLLGSEAIAGQFGVWGVESQQFLDAIAEGDWVAVKDDIEGFLIMSIPENMPDFLEGMDLDLDYTYKGVKIFSDYSEEAGRLAIEYVSRQVELVPDKTESYQHPNIEILKAQIASL